MDVPVGEVSEPIAPIEPTPAVRAELAAYLQQDSSAVGDVWRRTVAGETPDHIQAARGTSRSTSVWSFNRVAAAILEGDLPTAPTVALACARKFRRILATTSLSPETVQTLTVNLHELERRSGDNLAREAEERQALRSTSEAEASAETGIYVYALPHYLRYPYEPDSGRTLLKVGHSGRGVMQRFAAQTRTTALPEEPILLRVYATGERDTGEVERQVHRLLEAADHARSAARTAGTEWFLTSLKFLDAIADTLGLHTRVVFDPHLEE